MRRRALLLLMPALAWAQPDWRRVAVPYVAPQAWLESLWTRWYVPRSREFADAARALVQAQGRLCDGGAPAQAQAAWRRAMTAWERLSAVAIGPLLERRSARRIDFAPTRPALIRRAIEQGESDLARVGAPAKGLPALEWLLWKQRPAAGSPSCAYAQRVAAEIADEAAALADAFATPREWSDEAVAASFGELLNQLVAGIEGLRWAQIERPLKEGKRQFPRAASGASAQAWAARWDALRQLVTFQAHAPDAPVSLEAFLRGRGLNPLADRVVDAVRRGDAALRHATPADAAALQQAASALSTLKRRVEEDVAPALDVSIGFTDADGD